MLQMLPQPLHQREWIEDITFEHKSTVRRIRERLFQLIRICDMAWETRQQAPLRDQAELMSIKTTGSRGEDLRWAEVASDRFTFDQPGKLMCLPGDEARGKADILQPPCIRRTADQPGNREERRKDACITPAGSESGVSFINEGNIQRWVCFFEKTRRGKPGESRADNGYIHMRCALQLRSARLRHFTPNRRTNRNILPGHSRNCHILCPLRMISTQSLCEVATEDIRSCYPLAAPRNCILFMPEVPMRWRGDARY
jgi:hypothetical protein